jgi:signal transduction histidine kinase/sensor domain CHASE-containing protein
MKHLSSPLQRLRSWLQRPTVGALLATLLALLILLPGWWLASQWYESRLLNEAQSRAVDLVSLRASALSAALNRRISLLDGLYAFSQVVIQDENFGKNFEIFAAGVYNSTSGIRTIAVAPGGVVYYVYPIEDNVRVVGYDPLNDPRPGVRDDVERAIETGQIVLSGPTELADGGIGVIARKAVFQGDQYWGLVNLVIDLGPILELADIGTRADEYNLVLQDQAGQIFYGSEDVTRANPVAQRINLPDGIWVLAGVPVGGWQAAIRSDLLIFQSGLMTIVLLIASLVYLSVNHQAQLAVSVRQRTREISQVNEELEQAYQLLEQRVEERTREITALLELGRNVASTLELSPLLELVLSQLKTVLDYTGAGITTLEGGYFVFLDYQGPAQRDQVLNLRILARQPSGYREVMRSRQPVIYDDLRDTLVDSAEIQFHRAGDLSEYFGYVRSWLGVPLMVKERIIGILRVDHEKPNRFNHQDAQLVLAFANQAAVAIENARLYEGAQSLAALEERQRLARELHDSVSQALYGIALGARTARTLLDRQDAEKEQLNGPLDYVLSLAEAGLAEMRALIFELRPESLESEGLVVALNKRAEAISARHQINVNLDLCEEPPIPLKMKESLYRVAQEALNNIVKHARATRVDLSLACVNGTIDLEVKDNGTGFDSNQDFPGHFGLHTMRERIEGLGGEFVIESALTEGTRIFVRVPISEK